MLLSLIIIVAICFLIAGIIVILKPKVKTCPEIMCTPPNVCINNVCQLDANDPANKCPNKPCIASHHCVNGVCIPKPPCTATSCGRGMECTRGICQDKVPSETEITKLATQVKVFTDALDVKQATFHEFYVALSDVHQKIINFTGMFNAVSFDDVPIPESKNGIETVSYGKDPKCNDVMNSFLRYDHIIYPVVQQYQASMANIREHATKLRVQSKLSTVQTMDTTLHAITSDIRLPQLHSTIGELSSYINTNAAAIDYYNCYLLIHPPDPYHPDPDAKREQLAKCIKIPPPPTSLVPLLNGLIETTNVKFVTGLFTDFDRVTDAMTGLLAYCQTALYKL